MNGKASLNPANGMEALIQSKIASELQQYFFKRPAEHLQHQFGAALSELYRSRQYRLIWSDKERQKNLMTTLFSAADEGLNPQHYAAERLNSLFSKDQVSRISQVRTDLLASENLMRLLAHLYYGKVDPQILHPSFSAEHEQQLVDMVPAINRAIDRYSIPELTSGMTPKHQHYIALKQQLHRLRATAKKAVWPMVQSDRLIRPGDTAKAVHSIRQRLKASTDAGNNDQATPGENNDDDYYDPGLVWAVKQFQQQHQLAADGIIGSKTIAAMNVPLSAKIDTIRANLERLRWVLKDLQENYVLVDIAGFEINLYKDSRRVWSARAQVGRPFRETPVFRSQIEYLEWNPDWTVPPTVIKEDLLPKIVKNPAYITEHHFQLLDHYNQPLAMSDVAWDQLNENYIPFKLRQSPGPHNALGRVKFIFPNPHYVYLHDTPSKKLFDAEQRAFSSGCIRIEKPYELAEILMATSPPHKGQAISGQQRIKQILSSNLPEREYLAQPLPILLVYRTVQITEEGRLKFNPDIYHRDKKLLAALDRQQASSHVKSSALHRLY